MYVRREHRVYKRAKERNCTLGRAVDADSIDHDSEQRTGRLSIDSRAVRAHAVLFCNLFMAFISALGQMVCLSLTCTVC